MHIECDTVTCCKLSIFSRLLSCPADALHGTAPSVVVEAIRTSRYPGSRSAQGSDMRVRKRKREMKHVEVIFFRPLLLPNMGISSDHCCFLNAPGCDRTWGILSMCCACASCQYLHQSVPRPWEDLAVTVRVAVELEPPGLSKPDLQMLPVRRGAVQCRSVRGPEQGIRCRCRLFSASLHTADSPHSCRRLAYRCSYRISTVPLHTSQSLYPLMFHL